MAVPAQTGRLLSAAFTANMETNLGIAVQNRIEQADSDLGRRFGGPLRVIAKQSVTVWFNHGRLDRLLAEYIGVLEGCELIFAIDETGRQVSSNIYPSAVDSSVYGQDLSRRPYAITLSVLNDVANQGAFVCNEYTSLITLRPCVTVMHPVTSRSSLLGFIAADFDPATGSDDT